jgi:hypothetical protein
VSCAPLTGGRSGSSAKGTGDGSSSVSATWRGEAGTEASGEETTRSTTGGGAVARGAGGCDTAKMSIDADEERSTAEGRTSASGRDDDLDVGPFATEALAVIGRLAGW